MPDATADQVAHRLRQQEAYVGGVALQYITATTTKFDVEGWRVKEGIRPETGRYSFSFPPNEPKYLAEFVRALNYPHLYLSVYVSHLPGTELSGNPPTNIIDWMEVVPEWRLYSVLGLNLDHIQLSHYWNEVKIDRWNNTVRIVT
jgi:hypothetical protein